MQIEIIYLATSGMIFLYFVFRRYKWSKVKFCWKKTAFCPIKIFYEKRDGHSKRERKKIIVLHLKRVFAGTTTNFSNDGFFPAKRHVTCHVTRQKYQFYFKMFRTLKTELCAKSDSIAMIPLKNIANKLFLPVKAFDPRSRLFAHFRFSGPSSQMFTDDAFFLVWGGHT